MVCGLGEIRACCSHTGCWLSHLCVASLRSRCGCVLVKRLRKLCQPG